MKNVEVKMTFKLTDDKFNTEEFQDIISPVVHEELQENFANEFKDCSLEIKCEVKPINE